MRGRYRSHVALIALLALGLGTALASFTAAWRTDHAYTDYLRRANVNPLVINPLLVTDRLLELVRTTPGVESVSMSRFLTFDTADLDPAKVEEFGASTESQGIQDGRYLDVDRPVIVDGRMLAAEDEIFLDKGAANAYDLHIGDQLSLTMMPTQPNGPPPEELPPIGTERVTVVGIGVFADEVLPDDLYTHAKVILSPQLTAKYSCVPHQPESTDTRSIDELVPIFFPTNCASDATLLSLRLTHGDAGVADVLAELDARVAAENSKLPGAMREANFGYQVIPTVTVAETERVQRSVEPVVLALRLLGLSALMATVALALVAAHRTNRDTDGESHIWSQLGVDRTQRALAAAAPTAIAIVIAIGIAAVAGWLASAIGPVASVSVLDPSPARGIPPAIAAFVLPAVLIVLLGGLSLSAWYATANPQRRVVRVRTNRLADAAAKTGDVPLALGVHAAMRGRSRGGSGLLLGATIAAIAVVAAALVYSTNLAGLVRNPARYGWTYDVAATINAGFDGADPAAIERVLDRPDVAGWAVATTAFSATIDGVKLPAIADVRGLADLGMPLIEGRLPRSDHEIALGSTSARRLGVAPGAQVMIETDYGESTAIVTGIVVLPAVGTFLADRAALGTGVVLSAPLFRTVAGSISGFETLGGFVAIDLQPGVDPATFVTSLGDAVLDFDTNRRPPTIYTDPVQPAQISDLAAVKTAPVVLAALIALTMVVGLVASLSRAIRVRRRELAICRALGCRGVQLYATVCWQAVTIVVIGLLVGVPAGVIAGSNLWRRFAANLGIRPTPVQPLVWIGVVIGGALVIAVAAAMLPGRRAAAAVPAAALRESQ